MSTLPFSIQNADEPYSPSLQMMSPLRKFRRTTELMFQPMNGSETPSKRGSLSSSSLVTGCGGGTASFHGLAWTGLRKVSAPVGQEIMHSPQATQVDSPMGVSRSKAMW